MSSSRELHYYIESKANALQIPDLKTAYNALKFLGVETKGKGIKTKNDAIGLIIEQLSRGVKVPEQVKKETSRGLRKAVEEDRHSRDKLLGKYEGVNGFYRELPTSYQKDLAQVFPGIQSEFETRRNQLQKSECTILVAGETASGKSSLINLLLGGVDILPTSTLGCTSTVCEIRGSKHGKKEAVGFFRSENDETKKTKSRSPVVFDLSTDRGISQFQNEVKDSDEDGNSKYKRMEITWPFEMLEEGIVIVDTPGIGGGGNMAKYAERYLSKSYGFIYVINSANAGGVQKGRLQNFMRLVINAAGEEGYNSDSTMFVCNRWDMIPEGDREAVKEDTLKKLSKFYTDIRRSQVHYMSIHEASRALQYQTVTPEYTQLTGLVEKLLPDTLRARLNSHYRWLSAVIKRSIYSLKVSKVMAAKSMEKNKDEFIQVKKQIEKLETRSRDSISYLKTGIRQKSEDVTEMVSTVLQSRQIAERLFDWQPHEFPKDDKKKVGDALERIATKIAVEMNRWERENSIVAGLKDNIIRVCKRDFELMEGQIAKIEGALLDGDTKIVQDLHKSIKKQAPVKQLWKKAKESSVEEDNSGLKGLGGAIVTVSNLKPNDKRLKKIFDGYKPRDTGKTIAKMQDATKLYLDSIFDSKKLPSKIFTFLERFAKGIDAVAKMIPDFLKADLQLMEILRESMTSTESNLKELFPKFIHSSHLLLGQLDLFYLNYIMVFDYSLDEINWDPSEGPIGSGSFADVYIADVKQAGGRKLPVALKVCKDILTENTVSDILLEDRTLRELDHPNIVRYYGATYRFRDKKKQKDMFWIMILEVCKYTLKQKFVNTDVNNPGKLIADSASQIQQMVTMADFALQLCRGLAYLHGKGIVHRDLKLENILVTDKNIVKLTDVGLAKPKTDIAFSIVGSPVYMAPEVLLQSQNYDYKADIYGLAIVLWEMWYGKDAADYIQNQLFGSLEQSIKDGLRPSLKLSTKPPESWINLIEKSWAYDPKIRPAVAAHCDFFEAFIKQSRRS